MQRDLHVEDDAKLRFYSNVLYPVEALLGGAETRFTGMLGVSDFILCTNNPTVGLMPVEIKMFHNLRLGLEKGSYLGHLAINDTIDNRLDRVMDDNFTSYDDDYDKDDDNDDDPGDDPDDDYIPPGSSSSKKRKSSSIQTGSKKRVTAPSSKGITTIECQGRAVPRLLYKGYIYDGYLFALVLQLIEGAHHVDPKRLTKEEKKIIVSQYIIAASFTMTSQSKIFYMNQRVAITFFIDFGLSEIVDNESPKLRKEEIRLKKFLRL
ncbi:kinase-like domain-containing protein [Rhizophagus irregularis DAOM 181602=DAOM 197198]|nr:kinase-like domain-containing protein [Rhizophagus irregularis DAOM 181602=DAOM 197198]